MTSVKKLGGLCFRGLTLIDSSVEPGGLVLIDIVIADHQELFHAGIAEIVANADDICLMAQPQSAEQLLSVLKTVVPQVLLLSTHFLPEFSKIQPVLKRGRTALLLLAEDNDKVAYLRWLGAQGVAYRSIDGPALIDAMRRVARGELFVQDRSSDIREEPSEVA